MSDNERMAWSGSCEGCNAITIVYPHPEATEDQREWIESREDWEGFSYCLVCGDLINWNGTDPVKGYRL